MTKVIHVGEGRHIEIDERPLLLPPPPAPKEKPAWNAWVSRRRYQLAAAYPKHTFGVSFGMIGFHKRLLKKDVPAYWAGVRAIAVKEVEKMKNEGVEMDARAEEALVGLMTIAKSDVMTRDKISAFGKVLEFTKSKPATKQEVAIKSPEDWLDELPSDDSE